MAAILNRQKAYEVIAKHNSVVSFLREANEAAERGFLDFKFNGQLSVDEITYLESLGYILHYDRFLDMYKCYF